MDGAILIGQSAQRLGAYHAKVPRRMLLPVKRRARPPNTPTSS